MFLIHESDVEPTELEGRTTYLLVSRSSGSRALTHNVSYFRPGHAPGHVHDPEEEVFYVDAGEGEVWIDGVPFRLAQGTAVHTPTGVEHNIHATGDVPMRIIGSFSPHVVPGSYPNLPPRSHDLIAPPSSEAKFVVRANLSDGGGAQSLISTERMTLRLRTIPAGERWHVVTKDRDEILHVLVGRAKFAVGHAVYQLRVGSVVVMGCDEAGELTAIEMTRLLDITSEPSGQ
ncbi:MAG TPA: cupin domain-containing protein [Candidatus Eisenbacteria bacterium]|nr:cupin domain-containing protein [Candidatus Eisenbacteria bacterium]